jgi:hemolysin D
MSVTTEGGHAPPLTLKIASRLFEIEAADPSGASRTVLKTVCSLFGVLLVWAVFGKLDIVAVAEGRLVPETYVKIVQPAEGGVVRELLVKEGDAVQAGQVLARLDPTLATADAKAVSSEFALQRMQARRIESELAGTPLHREPGDDALLFSQVQAQGRAHRQTFLDAVAGEQAARQRTEHELVSAAETLKKLETTLPSYERQAQAFERLATQNLVGQLQAEEKRREVQERAQDLESQRATVESLRSALSQHDRRLAQIKSTYESDLNALRLETLSRISQLEQSASKNTYREGLLELRAPQAGIVKELATTTLGAVIQPGTVLMSLVPDKEPLVAEVAIQNQDIGFVQVGQPVRIKVAAYQFQKYGMLEGKVRTVSADANQPNSTQGNGPAPSSPMFKALIELDRQQIEVNGLDLPTLAGMQVSAEIVQGERTVLEYLLSTVQRVRSEAGMER